MVYFRTTSSEEFIRKFRLVV